MKKLLTIAIISLLSVNLFVGCGALNDLADVTFNATYSTDLNVNVSPTGMKAGIDGVFNVSSTIDPLSDTEFAKYANKIKKVEMVEATAEIVEISAPIVLQSATLSASSTGFTTASWSFANETLVVGKKLTLGNESGQFTNLQNILNSKNVFTVRLQGQSDVNTGTFKVKVTYKTKITANPL